MLTRRKKNNNNKSKKLKKYVNRNNTRKRCKTGGTLDNIRRIKTKKNEIKTKPEFKKRAKGRRGLRIEFVVAKTAGQVYGDPKLAEAHIKHQNEDPTAKVDIPSSLSSKLPGDISVKSVAKTKSGQKKYQICMGDSCRTFDSFLEVRDIPLLMAIVIRCEDEIENRKIPLDTKLFDMYAYKEALFGYLTDAEIRRMSAQLSELEKMSKKNTYDVFKPFPNLETATAAGVTYQAAADEEEIERRLSEINQQLQSRNAKLVVRLSKGNFFKKRAPRIVSHFSYSPESPRIKRSERPESRMFAAKMPHLSQSSSSSQPGNGSAAVASPVAAASPISVATPSKKIIASRASSASRGSLGSRRSIGNRTSSRAYRSSLSPRASATRSVRNKLIGISKIKKLSMIPEELKKSEISIGNLLPEAYSNITPSSRPYRSSKNRSFRPSSLSNRPILRSMISKSSNKVSKRPDL